MRVLYFDTETYSAIDLVKVGSYIYARHATTDVRLVTYCLAIDGLRGEVKVWQQGDPVPQEFIEVANDPSALVKTFNDAFDRQIQERILTPRYSFPAFPIARRRCVQAAALSRALPASLDAAAAALGIATRKDPRGVAIMRRLAKPRRQTAQERKAGKPLDFSATPGEMATLIDYALGDPLMTMEIDDCIGPLPPSEQALWELDQLINERGVHVDVRLIENAIEVGGEAKLALYEEIAELTGGTVTAPGQTQRILKWMAEHGCRMSNLQKSTVADVLREPRLSAEARRLLELRQAAGGAAALKFATLKRWTSPESEPRIHYAYRYHGGSAGRFTSMGVQLHNLRKPEIDDIPGAIAAIATGNLGEIRRRGFARPLETIGHLSRAAIIPRLGSRFFIADLSGIEARGAALVCGAKDELEQWRAFDRSGRQEDEPYYRTGLKTFGQPPERARKAGKIGSLAFQYQGGIGAYRRVTGDDTLPEETVAARRDAWRVDHPDFVLFWRLSVFQAVQAIRNPGMEFTAGLVTFKYIRGTGFLELRLPSGRIISYPKAEIIEDEQYGTISFTFLDASGSKNGRMYHERRGSGVFGGLMLENIVQALCRDVFVEAMPRLEAAGYPLVMHTHDEFVCEVPDGSGSLEEFLTAITQPPTWAPDLPIAANARISDRLIEILEPSKAPEVIADNAIDNAQLEDESEELTTVEEELPEVTLDLPASALELPSISPVLPPVASSPVAFSPPPVGMELHVCAQCLLEPPDGTERLTGYNDVYLHERCERAFLQARMAAEGMPWIAPPSPQNPPPPSPPKSNGNGHSDDGFDLDALLNPQPTPSYTGRNGNGGDGYPHGEERGPAAGAFVAEYIYRSADGRLHTRVVRTSTKQFPTYHWGAGEWLLGWPEKAVPYRLVEFLAAPADAVILVCEGEKDCDAGARYGLITTCNPGGAGKWQPELTDYFKGKPRVCIIQDNDEAGAKHAAKVRKALRDVVPTIGVVTFPELGPGGDLSDFFAAGGSKLYLQTRIDAALKAGSARPYVIIPASEVELENVSWLWPGHLAHGALELLTGDPDLGKSQIQMSYAACVTRGTPWPDGVPGSQAQQVLLVTAEDNYANTVGPRALAAGIDLTALLYFKGLVRNGQHEIFLLSSGLEALEQLLLDHENIGLVLIDPITAYMGSPTSGRFDSHRATDVRSVLGPLKDLAERHRIAISAITHPPKGAKASPLDSFIGSQAYIAAARIAHLCVPETESGLAGAVRNTGRVFFTQVKNNLASKVVTLAYHLDTKSVGPDRSGEPLKPAPYVQWEGAVDITSAEALAQARAVAKTKVNPVHEFLRDILASGPVLQKIVVERGAAKGISLPQLRRARKAVGAVTFKRRGGNVISPWLWALPEHVPDDVEREEESTPEGDA